MDYKKSLSTVNKDNEKDIKKDQNKKNEYILWSNSKGHVSRAQWRWKRITILDLNPDLASDSASAWKGKGKGFTKGLNMLRIKPKERDLWSAINERQI